MITKEQNKIKIKQKWFKKQKFYKGDIVVVNGATAWDFDFKGLNYDGN